MHLANKCHFPPTINQIYKKKNTKLLKDTSHDDSVSVPILGQLASCETNVFVRTLSVRNLELIDCCMSIRDYFTPYDQCA